MSKIYQFKVEYPNIEVEAENLKDAKLKAADRLDALSGSNTGSEMIANAPLEYLGYYVCDHEKTSTYSYRCTRGGADGIFKKLDVTSVSCKRCHKHLSETEVAL